MGHDVFISHSSQDKAIADAVCAVLEQNGLRCWIAPRDILPGASWASSILEGIAGSRLMVLIFSAHANDSQQIRREVERAVHHGIAIAPLRIADVLPAGDLEYFLSASHWMDALKPPLELQLRQLAQNIRSLLATQVAPGAAAQIPSPREEAPPVQPVASPRQSQSTGVAMAVAVTLLLTIGLFVGLAFWKTFWPQKLEHPITQETSAPASQPIRPAVPPSPPSPSPSLPSPVVPSPVLPPPVLPPPVLPPTPPRPPEKAPASQPVALTNTIGMQFVRIAPGEFMMGSPASEAGRLAGETQHQVRLTHPFLLGAHLVTRGQFAQFVREASYQSDAEKEGSAFELVGRAVRQVKGASWKKPGFEQTNLDPVVSVSWNDAQAFCAWLSKKEEKEKRTYRLPTEAQWEYACRAGAATAYPWGNDIDGGQGFCNIADKTLQAKFPDVAAIDWSDGFMHTSPVGTFRPNAWGLYDMVGNALEWCEDWMGPYPTGHVVDPKGPALGTFRILRGGSWSDAPALCRSAQRFERPQDYRSAVTGFRCLLDVP